MSRRIRVPDPSVDAPPDSTASVAQLWLDFKQSRSVELRDRLILHYTPLVRYVAGRVGVGLPPTVERADLVSYGVFGLIDAINKYEPSREVKFETYALTRIRGAIIDELRSIDWIPRSLRTKSKDLDKAHITLEAELGRAPTEQELAEEMGMTVSDLRHVIGELSYGNVVALDELLAASSNGDGERVSLVDTLQDQRVEAPGSAIEDEEMKAILAQTISLLPTREKVVVALYYYEGLTLAEIGQVLGVTESRICQMHSKAVTHLKGKLVSQIT